MILSELAADPAFWSYVAVGFFAQMVDGALGMAYGTLSTAVLLATGLPPVTASASVHTAQFFTTGLSALSHTWFKNTRKKMLVVLAASGVLGGMLGALLLTNIDGNFIKPWISAYLLLLGLGILWKLYRGSEPPENPLLKKSVFRSILGFCGGFLDALGGGGWGPIVTSNLIARGEDPRSTIGTVNTAEFFVKTAIAITFISAVTFHFHQIVIGLLVGGIVAAPFGAYVLRYIRPQLLMAAVGIVITLLSLFVIYQAVYS